MDTIQEKHILIIRVIIIVFILSGTYSTATGQSKSNDSNFSVSSVSIQVSDSKDSIVNRIAQLMKRQIKQRCTAKFESTDQADFMIGLSISKGIGHEGYKIYNSSKHKIEIIGNDHPGLLAGVGKFLHGSIYHCDGFTPCSWRGISVPQSKIRGIFFATHFHNFYHDAPIECVQRYVEELGLWGFNTLVIWFDMHHYNGITDPEAQKMIQRLHAILLSVQDIGMKPGITMIANEGYANSPEHLRAQKPVPRKGNFHGVEICPNKPGAKKLLLKQRKEIFRAFKDIDFHLIDAGAYDGGGCGCPQCSPWGGNGYLFIVEPIFKMAKEVFPAAKTAIYSWYFDKADWEALDQAMEIQPDWLDYIYVESTQRQFIDYPFRHQIVPGGIKYLGFPEISMWQLRPWGGFGANPIPSRCQAHWDKIKDKNYDGGVPYSEGIFEDINKVIYCQFYWDKEKKATETVKEYIAFEYSPEVIDEILTAIEIIEHNHTERWSCPPTSPDALDLLEQARQKLSSNVQNSWRWQILFLRAQLDRILLQSQGKLDKSANEILNKLTNIYYAQNADPRVKPSIETIYD